MKNVICLLLSFLIVMNFSSCTMQLKQPIGIWRSESPYMVVDFNEGPAKLKEMSCTILIDGEEYVFKDAYMRIDSGQSINFGERVLDEEFYEEFTDTQYIWNNQLSFSYSFAKNTLIATVEESIFPEEFPVGSKFTLVPDQETDNYTIY